MILKLNASIYILARLKNNKFLDSLGGVSNAFIFNSHATMHSSNVLSNEISYYLEGTIGLIKCIKSEKNMKDTPSVSGRGETGTWIQELCAMLDLTMLYHQKFWSISYQIFLYQYDKLKVKVLLFFSKVYQPLEYQNNITKLFRSVLSSSFFEHFIKLPSRNKD